MALSDEARQMLAAAYKDWRALAGMADPDVFADEVFGFHAQQAVEKALKAWLALLGVEYPRTTTKSWNPLQMIEARPGGMTEVQDRLHRLPHPA